MRIKRIKLGQRTANARGRNDYFKPHQVEISTGYLHHYGEGQKYHGTVPSVTLEIHSKRYHKTAPALLAVTPDQAMLLGLELIRAAQAALDENHIEEYPPCASTGSALSTSQPTPTPGSTSEDGNSSPSSGPTE